VPDTSASVSLTETQSVLPSAVNSLNLQHS